MAGSKGKGLTPRSSKGYGTNFKNVKKVGAISLLMKIAKMLGDGGNKPAPRQQVRTVSAPKPPKPKAAPPKPENSRHPHINASGPARIEYDLVHAPSAAVVPFKPTLVSSNPAPAPESSMRSRLKIIQEPPRVAPAPDLMEPPIVPAAAPTKPARPHIHHIEGDFTDDEHIELDILHKQLQKQGLDPIKNARVKQSMIDSIRPKEG